MDCGCKSTYTWLKYCIFCGHLKCTLVGMVKKNGRKESKYEESEVGMGGEEEKEV